MRSDVMSGATLVAGADLRATLRGRRWRPTMVGWFVVVSGVAWLIVGAAQQDPYGAYERSALDAELVLVLTLLMLACPIFLAGSVNGDTIRGVLAPMQLTGLAPASIAIGKFMAGWLAGLIMLGIATPAIVVLAVLCHAAPLGVVVALVVIALIVGFVCAVSLGFSALFSRPAASTAAAYLLVVALAIGTILAANLAVSDVDVESPSNEWIVAAPNPYVLLADAIPPDQQRVTDYPYQASSLANLRSSLRSTRQQTECESYACVIDSQRYAWLDATAVWPYGLGFDLVLAGIGLYLATRRLRAPVVALPAGTRIG